MLSQRAFGFVSVNNFLGTNTKDSNINMLDGEWNEDSINIVSNPQGALGSRAGFSALTSASIGSGTAWCGFTEFQVHSGGSTTKNYVGGCEKGFVWTFASGAYTKIWSTALAVTSADDKRYNFFTLNNTLIIIPGAGDLPLYYTGSGSAATLASGVTADWGIEWQRYGWLHSTVDPRLLYYCAALGDPRSSYVTFLNFDDDGEPLKGCGKQGDDLIVAKEHSLHRIQYRGTTPLFKKYQIPTAIGSVNHETIKTLPDGSLIFLAPDCNFYRLLGDTAIPVGDNIQGFIRDGVASRLQYAVAGILQRKNQYWCSFSYTTGATQNDRTVVMDWSRPYPDRWGKTQFPWFIFDIGANCFAEASISGEDVLYHGNYLGRMFKDDTGTSDANTALRTFYRSKSYDFGDPTMEKKFIDMEFTYESKGNWDLDISIVCDENAATQKIMTQNMLTGVGDQPLWDVVKWDDFNWASESNADTSKEISRQGKLMYITFGTDGVDEAWNMLHYIIHARAMRRVHRSRESS